MVLIIDTKDRKLLHELDLNARQSNAEIAKKIGLSKQLTGFRIKRLMQERILSSFFTVIDITKLGFTIHKIFLRLQNMDQEKENTFVEFLKKNPNIVWLASCDGRYDLAFGVWARNMEYLDMVMGEINKRFGKYISERQIASIIRGEYFVRDYLIEKEVAKSRKYYFGSAPEPADLDENDWKILTELGKNTRTTSVDISRTISMSADAVAKRIKKLEESGIVRHYNILPNESKYPYLHYKVLVGLKNLSEERERALREYCRMQPNIVYIVKALGPWEFEIDMEVENIEQFREIMMRIKTEFDDILKDYSALHIYQVHKYNFCPSVQAG